MTYTTVMDMNVGSLSTGAALAEAKLWWSILAGGFINDTLTAHLTPNTLGHPLFVDDGADSYLRFKFADDAAINGMGLEIAGSYSTKDKMDADLEPANGTYVQCFDPDGTKRGIYFKDGASGTGSWSILTSYIRDKLWPDYNHPQRLLELMVCSFAYSANPLPFMGSQMGYRGITNGDWRNARLTWDMRAVDLQLGPHAKIGQHVQGNEPKVAAALTAKYAEGDKYFLPNFMQTRQLISDQLGFGQNSWGRPNDVPIVRDSDRRDVVIDYSTDDSDWECFGDPGRDPAGRMINYGSSPVEEVLTNLQGNSYMLAHHPTPKDGTDWWTKSSAETIPEFDRVRGEIHIYGVKLEQWTA